MKIGIDMGHCLTGFDTSARGVFVESDYNRKIGKKVIEKLKAKGHEVVNCTIDSGAYSMYDSLAKRVKIANDNNVDLFCSIHFNAGGGHGTETFLANRSAFASEDNYNKNYAIAKRVNDKVVESCGFRNRGVKHEDFYVIYNTKALAILVEVCFCDSQEDFAKLDVEKVAVAICEGLTGEKYSDEAPGQSNPTDNLYRIRKSWQDAKSQIGAYRVLENAIKETDARSRYSVFDSKGNKVYPIPKADNSKPIVNTPPTMPNQGEYIIKQYPERGVFTCTVDAINFRGRPYVGSDNPIQGQYFRGEKVNYDYVVITNKYVWISWIGASTGTRRYMPITDRINNEKWGYVV
jgi:N-acetylmuramoyl-L-alanine amidase